MQKLRKLVHPTVILAWLLTAFPSNGAELLMLEQPGCVWCQLWDEEIGRSYSLTRVAQVVPLRRVDITKPWPEDLRGIRGDRLTPTFILIDQGKEVARMRGYPGDNFFWPLLEEMIARLSNKNEPLQSFARDQD